MNTLNQQNISPNIVPIGKKDITRYRKYNMKFKKPYPEFILMTVLYKTVFKPTYLLRKISYNKYKMVLEDPALALDYNIKCLEDYQKAGMIDCIPIKSIKEFIFKYPELI